MSPSQATLRFARQQFRRRADADPVGHADNAFLQHLEAQVVALGYAEARVAVGERLVDAGAPVAAAFVERDQFVADVDHGHAHRRQPPFVARDALGFGQHAPCRCRRPAARAAPRTCRNSRRPLRPRRARRPAARRRARPAACGCAGVRCRRAAPRGVGAAAVEQVGFGGPALRGSRRRDRRTSTSATMRIDVGRTGITE